jgi:hypothetical protein
VFLHHLVLICRETKKGWPLLTDETEATGDFLSTNEGGTSLVGSLGCRAGTTDFYSAFDALFSLVQNIFSYYFNLCVPIAQQPGHAVVQGRLSLNLLINLYFIAKQLFFRASQKSI